MSNPGISLNAAPDYSLQQAQILQQQQLARALAQAGSEPLQASSAGGIAAPISSLSVLAKALNSFGGAYLSGKASSDSAGLTKQEREDAAKMLSSFYKAPDSQGLTPNVSDQPTQMSFSAPPVGGGPGMTANATVQSPTVGTPQMGNIPGAPTSYPQQQQMLNQFAMSDNPYLQKIAPELYAQSKPQFVQQAPGATLNQYNPSTGQMTNLGTAPLAPTQKQRDAMALYGPGYATDPRYIEGLRREALGIKSPEAQKQAVEQAGAMAGARAQGSQGTLNTDDPINQSWMKAVLSGNATMQQVPAARRDSVSMGLSDAPKAAYSPLASSRLTMAANRIVGNYIKLPQYELTANGLPYLERIDAALKTPGSVSDQDLLDSLTKLNTAGNAVTDAQVKIITDGKSYSDWANTIKNKFVNGGVLSENQRAQIKQIANNIYDNYKKGYQPVYEQATKQLNDAGIPEAFWTIPDLNKLNGQQSGAQGGQPAPASGGWGPVKVITP